jgi:hypothetical protein
MFVGVLLLCASVTDVSSCDVKMNGKTFYDTKEECRLEMFEVAKYAANLLQKVTKPYCFKIVVHSA